jgi:TDG/mug DNA glycosylase family protein
LSRKSKTSTGEALPDAEEQTRSPDLDQTKLDGNLPDILMPHLAVVFCGLNPGATAVRAGHSFSSPSNRFWQTIFLAGFTPRKLRPDQEKELLQYGCGLTAVVSRATRSASELSRDDYAQAAPYLQTKVLKYAPRILAFLGKAAYSSIAAQKQITWGSQGTTFGGAEVWVLPNPSGLNRTFTLGKLVEAYTALRKAVTARGYD